MKQNIIIVLLSAICGLLGYMAAKMQDRPNAVQVAASAPVRAADSVAEQTGQADAGGTVETSHSKKSGRNCTKIGLPNPPYPEDAQNAGIEGEVSLEFEVKDDGSTQNVTIIKSSGNTSLDNMALRAVKSARYAKGNTECFKTNFNFRIIE